MRTWKGFTILLALCEGNLPVMWSFNILSDLKPQQAVEQRMKLLAKPWHLWDLTEMLTTPKKNIVAEQATGSLNLCCFLGGRSPSHPHPTLLDTTPPLPPNVLLHKAIRPKELKTVTHRLSSLLLLAYPAFNFILLWNVGAHWYNPFYH